ncbi:astacin-like metalloendopeptidase [Saccostrea cucullata]|uniref:astacin-like metalloendopeptidase n=1 Tax=Saccostrea cuccullata TaxID=36930 RepID=UPI002ED2E8A4
MLSTTNIVLLFVAVVGVFALPGQKRNIITDSNRLWANGKVPVSFDSSVVGSMKEKVLAAMQEISFSTHSNGQTCVQFVPRTQEKDYVVFTSVVYGSGDSLPGRLGGVQYVHLYQDAAKADIMQLIMYLLGFFNEFRRPDRDSQVIVHTDNIAPEYRGFFEITNDTTFFNYPFDFESITFFFPYAWAIDPSRPTLTPKYDSVTIPYKLSLSKYDILNIQREYKCGIENGNQIDLLDGTVSFCNFEFDLCEWTQLTDDDFDFQRIKGPGPNANFTGPMADYSSGNGYYIFAEATGEHNEEARVISPTLKAGEYCLRFYYFLYGQDIHKFRINTRVGAVDTVLDSLEGNQGGSWHTYSRNIKMNTDFKIFLEAIIGGTDNGDMAFDDVYIFRGRCIQ